MSCCPSQPIHQFALCSLNAPLSFSLSYWCLFLFFLFVCFLLLLLWVLWLRFRCGFRTAVPSGARSTRLKWQRPRSVKRRLKCSMTSPMTRKMTTSTIRMIRTPRGGASSKSQANNPQTGRANAPPLDLTPIHFNPLQSTPIHSNPLQSNINTISNLEFDRVCHLDVLDSHRLYLFNSSLIDCIHSIRCLYVCLSLSVLYDYCHYHYYHHYHYYDYYYSHYYYK